MTVREGGDRHMNDSFLLTRVLLTFESDSDDVIGDLSAIARTPDGHLWVGSDELTSIERLTRVGSYAYGDHHVFNTGDFLDLFNADSEIDIEGLDYSQGYLWFVGSHSFKRKKPKGKKAKKDIQRLSTIDTDDNRFLLARIPVHEGALVSSCLNSDAPGGNLSAASLEKTDQRNMLMSALSEDPHLGPFIQMKLPSKDNGFDIEGITVTGNRVFLGLRGPVLRGWAIILELELEESSSDVLVLKELENGDLYRKHFVDLNGLGVRELCLQGDDMLILAGPTMDLFGEMQVLRLKDLLEHSKDTLWDQESDALSVLFDVPYVAGADNAEGMTLFPCFGEEEELLIVYDSPDERRRPGKRSIFADVFRLPK
ncbi:MAG: DUF3616 domain-containing protein [Leptolyngbyaceae bacterium]|nr:DUF3616 domain-containing protein [Leptolyngbyaceae bacterium]